MQTRPPGVSIGYLGQHPVGERLRDWAGRAEVRRSVPRPTGRPSYAPAVVEILTSRVLLRPTDLDRSLRFYEQTVGLAICREWGSGSSRGVVFFLGGGGLLELSGGSGRPSSDAVSLVLQVRDVRATREHLVHSGVTVEEEPELKPWGLLEMTVHDPDGLALISVEVPPGHPRRGG